MNITKIGEDGKVLKVAHPFYGSAKWKACREAYKRKKHYICELCGRPADVVHHKNELGEGDYFVNPEKCYGEENLMCLCHNCHNKIHHSKQAIEEGYSVDMATGEIIYNNQSPPYPSKNFAPGKPLARGRENVNEIE